MFSIVYVIAKIAWLVLFVFWLTKKCSKAILYLLSDGRVARNEFFHNKWLRRAADLVIVVITLITFWSVRSEIVWIYNKSISNFEDIAVTVNDTNTSDKSISASHTLPESGANCATMFSRRANMEIPTVLENTSNECDYYVAPKITLTFSSDTTIEPGTKIIMGLGSSLNFRGGKLKAVGSAGKPIIFQGEKDIVGYWRGIVLNDLREGSLSHVDIINGGSTNRAGLAVSKGKVSIADVSVSKSYSNGMKISEGTDLLSFDRNMFSGNELAGLVIHIGLISKLDSYSDYVGKYRPNGIPMLDLGKVYIKGTDNEMLDLGVPYLVDSISLSSAGGYKENTPRLIIHKGVEVVIRSGGSIYNVNRLIVNGSVDDPVVFRGLHDKSWSHFHSNGTTVLRNVIIDGSGDIAPNSLFEEPAAFMSGWLTNRYYNYEYKNVTIKNSSGWGVYCYRIKSDVSDEIKNLVDEKYLKFVLSAIRSDNYPFLSVSVRLDLS